MVMAKGIANGFPLSGIVANKALFDTQTPGSMGGTYGGNAVACAAGIACADVMREDKILDNVNARSTQLLETLNQLKTDPVTGPLIAEVRGLGLVRRLPVFLSFPPLFSVPNAPFSAFPR